MTYESPDEILDATRTAIAMAHAAHRGDLPALIPLWNGATNQFLLVRALAELVPVAMSETAARFDATFDVGAALGEVAAKLGTIDPPGGSDA